MATSGVITGTMTARQVITAAMQDIGALGRSQTVNASDLALCIRHLNWMLKEWQADGINLWREKEWTAVWPADVAEGDLNPSIQDVMEVRYDDGTTERQLARWEMGDYQQLPVKTSSGTPTIYAVTRGLSAMRMRLWHVPTTNINLIITGARVVEDVTDAAQTLDIPQEWLSTVVANLGARLIMPFKLEDQNGPLLREAARLYALLRSYDRPASYFMYPESRGAYYG
jgi:hypothetical protein